MSPQSYAADLEGLVSSLKGGGYVIVFRHGATDDSQKDVYPFKFDDMTAQRQLSEKGRSMARELGEALKKLGCRSAKSIRASSIEPSRPASCLAARTSLRWTH
jgi:broad specificity phosphatase PhoE